MYKDFANKQDDPIIKAIIEAKKSVIMSDMGLLSANMIFNIALQKLLVALRNLSNLNKFVRTILMTGFDIDDDIFHKYTKKKIINGFVQKPVRLYDLIKEADTQLHSYEMQKCFTS